VAPKLAIGQGGDRIDKRTARSCAAQHRRQRRHLGPRSPSDERWLYTNGTAGSGARAEVGAIQAGHVRRKTGKRGFVARRTLKAAGCLWSADPRSACTRAEDASLAAPFLAQPALDGPADHADPALRHLPAAFVERSIAARAWVGTELALTRLEHLRRQVSVLVMFVVGPPSCRPMDVESPIRDGEDLRQRRWGDERIVGRRRRFPAGHWRRRRRPGGVKEPEQCGDFEDVETAVLQQVVR
jgi:hypothetical protein